MKKISTEFLLSSLGVVAILIVGLLTVECSTTPPCKPRVISGVFETVTDLRTTKDLAPGETFESTVEIELGKEFKDRYEVNLDSLKTYYVKLASANFTSDKCADLSFYEASIEFPQIGTVTESNRCSFPEFINIPDATGLGNRFIYFSDEYPGTNATAIEALKTNFADDFRNNKKIIVKIRLGAKNNIPAGFGVMLFLRSVMTYGVCD